MKLERSKNTIRNLNAGILFRVTALLCPFIVRTVFIYTLGEEYLGVDSLFTSILSVLSIANLGLGSAITFNMYQAIADDNTEDINALLYFYRKVYHLIGFVILGAGLLLIPFLDQLVKGGYPPELNITAIYLVFLGDTCINYFTFIYWGALPRAFQRSDVDFRINMFVKIGMTVLQIILLLTTKNYYAYLAILPVSSLAVNVWTKIMARKLFPEYRPQGKLRDSLLSSIKTRVKGLVVTKFCEVSRNTFDNIFVSAFLGLTQITIYGNYAIFITSLSCLFGTFSESVLAGTGNSIVTEDRDKNYDDMFRMNFIYMWVSGWATICLLCLYQHFMKLWVGEALLLPLSSVILFCLYFYALRMVDIRIIYEDACGIWWDNKFRALGEAVANIALNYILGKYFQMNGIIAATLISILVINFGYGSRVAYRSCFPQKKMSEFFRVHGLYFIITAVIGIITYYLCSLLPETIITFVLKIIMCVVVPNVLYILIYRKTGRYQDAMPWLLSRLGIKEGSLIWRGMISRG